MLQVQLQLQASVLRSFLREMPKTLSAPCPAPWTAAALRLQLGAPCVPNPPVPLLRQYTPHPEGRQKRGGVKGARASAAGGRPAANIAADTLAKTGLAPPQPVSRSGATVSSLSPGRNLCAFSSEAITGKQRAVRRRPSKKREGLSHGPWVAREVHQVSIEYSLLWDFSRARQKDKTSDTALPKKYKNEKQTSGVDFWTNLLKTRFFRSICLLGFH